MNGQRKFTAFISIGLLLFFISITGCALLWDGIEGNAVVKPYFSDYKKVTIIWEKGHTPELELYTLEYWMREFPNHSIVRRDDKGIEALIFISVNDQIRPDMRPNRNTDVSLKIIDKKSGEIAAVSNASGKEYAPRSVILESIRSIKERIESNQPQ